MSDLLSKVHCWAEAVHEVRGSVPLGRLFTNLDDHPELASDPDLMWILGWLEGAAAARGELPEQLIDKAKEAHRGMALHQPEGRGQAADDS